MTKSKMKWFERALRDSYTKLDQSEIFGIRRVFVPIWELRRSVCMVLEETDPTEFDQMLRELLSTDFGGDIELHGSTTKVYEERQNELFTYENKRWVFLSLRQRSKS